MTRPLAGILLSLLMMCSLGAGAGGFDSTQGVLAFGNKVMMDISQARFDDAWRTMKINSNIPAAGIDNFGRQYRGHYEQTIRHYGPSVGVELMKTEMAGQSFLRATYLVKYESTAITWFMIFYKVRDTWVLNEFNYDILSNANFIVTSGSASDGSATPGNPSLLMQNWRSEMESRLARIEQSRGAAPAPVPLIRSVQPDENLSIAGEGGGDADTLALLRQIEERLASLEEKYEYIVQQSTAVPAASVALGDGGADAPLPGDGAARLAALEEKVNRLGAGGAIPAGSVDGDQLAVIWKTLEVLKSKHPFADFPKGP
ncbi:MAG: hypothetical protein WDA10_11330 [Porticoccaceae bacterium]